MKVLLFALNASYQHTNLAVRCLAKPIRLAGHTVSIVETHLKDRRSSVLQQLYEADTEVYGFSVYLWNRNEMLAFAADLRSLRPEARIVFGGPEVSFADVTFFERYPFVDYLLRGEGEESFLTLLSDLPPAHTILDGAPYAGFADAGLPYAEEEALPKGGIVYYESARGCPYHCAYCLSAAKSYSGARLRMKSAEQTLSELGTFSDREEVRFVKLIDRTFNADPERAKAIWRGMLTGNFSKCYHFEICASLLDEESFDLLSRFPKGQIQLEIGVQSTMKEALRAVDRTEDPDKVLDAISRLHKMGNLHVHADLIAGLPHEDFARFGASFDALYGHCDQLQLGFLKLLAGAPLTERATRYGYRWQAEPPYEILQNNVLSYEDIMRLKGIAAANERFAGSGRFRHALSLLTAHFRSPFACLDAFSAFLGTHPSSLSQRAAYEAFFAFGISCLFPEQHASFRDALACDYLMWEVAPLPKVLASDKQPPAAYRERFLELAKKSGEHILPSNLACHAFVHTPNAVTLIDRRAHNVYLLPVDILTNNEYSQYHLADFLESPQI